MKWTLLGMAFFTFIVLFRIVLGIQDIYLTEAENSFFNFSIVCFILEIVSIFLVYKFNKIGVFLFPLCLFAEFFYYTLHGGLLIDNVVGIFWYIGFGLLFIIPVWDKFKIKK